MNTIFYFSFITLCSIMNRARGTQVFNTTGSTVLGRLFSMFMIAFGSSFMLPEFWQIIPEFLLLILWATPAWDKLWGMEIGDDPQNSKLTGLIQMAFRQLFLIPVIVFLALITNPQHLWFCLMAPLLSIPYMVFGAWKVSSTPIAPSEFTNGAIIGVTIILCLMK